ncbi:MAG TPA: shikimate dehydrogenase [Bryobacterales bacterium]|jgi:3-dehydroquinate dehydratase/shikimate dehydrogenase|nr:shikimate dehydrogenase [Bryobacterales bacterium]
MAYRSEFPPVCVALGCAERERLDRSAAHACDSGEEFLEIRLDMLEDPREGIGTIRRIKRRYPDVFLLATCRRKRNGGGFEGTIEEQLELLGAAIEAGAQGVDIEIETAAEAPERVAGLRERARVVVSYHNFQFTPPLAPILRRLEKAPADVYKLAAMARKPSDNWRLLDVARRYQNHPLVVVGMGETGVPSRILSLSRHSAFTYAAPPWDSAGKNALPGTAPGQLSSSLLHRQYRAGRHTCATAVYGVIGNPVRHSISPAVHNRAFQARRIDAVYVPFLVEEGRLRDFFQLAARLPVAGFSVTIPHKQRVLRYLDAVDPAARRIGAVNTVYRKQGKLRGANTDAAGVTAPLEKRLKLKNSKILIAGSGGAARGAAFALAEKGAQVFLTGRNVNRVRALARACGAEAVENERLAGRRFDVLVHATPLGMRPRIDECYFPDEIPAELVFDMVYNPLETRLLKKARAAGKTVISGLEMFLEQAALQFEIWTGTRAPRLAMETTAREALETS